MAKKRAVIDRSAYDELDSRLKSDLDATVGRAPPAAVRPRPELIQQAYERKARAAQFRREAQAARDDDGAVDAEGVVLLPSSRAQLIALAEQMDREEAALLAALPARPRATGRKGKR